ncbi:hypothetical protein SG34_020110 [Thalassomonas viridans]|uniref:Replicative DNA helicase n=1 Tax=Thalassomonas viridans TaxID=137584 RepID=A0AAE9Z1U4_9GAMM|nr:hypothetical protein [Thalassomonas viridans]WDE03668.1 hypothetical protein SG34_020110 [Thalassomonas viridans]
MKAPLFDKILKLAQDIAQASAADNEKLRADKVAKLQDLCQKSQGTANDHPLQWEMLADFTDDGDLALDIYQIALDKAEKYSLDKHRATIYLSMAERYDEFGEPAKALEFAQQANGAAQPGSDEELKTEIGELIARLSNACQAQS